MIENQAPAEYVVNYSRAGLVGRFANPRRLTLVHGDAVVVRGVRGDEVGVVKAETIGRFALHVGAMQIGEIVRPLSSEDKLQHDGLLARAQRSIADWQRTADACGCPLTILDAEIVLSGDATVLQVLPMGRVDSDFLAAELERQHGIRFTIHDLSREKSDEPEKDKGCGKPGCGSADGGGGCSSCGTGGGCSTGSCSKGKVANADEMTAYFADLRRQMERVALH